MAGAGGVLRFVCWGLVGGGVPSSYAQLSRSRGHLGQKARPGRAKGHKINLIECADASVIAVHSLVVCGGGGDGPGVPRR